MTLVRTIARMAHYEYLLWSTHHYAVQHYPCSIRTQARQKLALDAARAIANGRLALDTDIEDARRRP